MDALLIPKQDISQYETIFDKIAYLNETGLHLPIDKVNWPNEFPKVLPVSVRVAHDNRRIYLYYEVEGEELRAVNTKDFMSVWEDSCVEFFVQRKGEKVYRNFEFNVHGVLLASERESRESAQHLSLDMMSSIERFTTIKHQYKSRRQLSNWTLYAEIPKQAFGFLPNEELSNETIRANFYKCGDKTQEPHYISWNPIDLPKPDFHVPQFFGELVFE